MTLRPLPLPKPLPKPLPFPMRPRVTFKMPDGPLYVGSYHRLPVSLSKGLPIAKVDFTVPAGPKGGLISPSSERVSPEAGRRKPEVMLLVGFEPGDYVVEARHAETGALLGSGKFQVDALWRDKAAGPSQWFTGTTGGGHSAGAAWGGGGGGPQNVNVVPASGTRRLAILFVDTADQRYTSDAAAMQGHRDRWMDETVNGVTVGGKTRSCRRLFQEMSYGGFDLSAQVFGPVSLPGAWSDYFSDGGAPEYGLYQAAVTAGDGLVDWRNFDSVICVSQQIDGPPVLRAWPYANGGTFKTAEGDVSLGVISMPNEWGLGDDREIHETLSHELGHNLGLGDQYTPAVAGRNVGSWDLMDTDDTLPHLSIAHRLMLGWVKPEWVRSFDFATLGGNVDQTVTLHPIEQGAPPAGRSTGVEIRISDGWNYYLEYRSFQAKQIGDWSNPENRVVLGTDVVSSPWSPPSARPGILLLPPDGDADGEVFSNGENYRETDFSDPLFPSDFRIDVSGGDGTKADVRIRYGVLGKPDPSIRPWPAGPDRQWQSPDIEVRNARNAVDPAWRNVPWVGNANTVVAKVRNAGAVAAPQVRVNFYVRNYNVGGTPETFIGSDVKDVPAGATVEFSAQWTPPAEGHFCVVVRIPLYSTPAIAPATPVVEMTELNNLAQSNYDRFISVQASPPSREVTTVEVGNPYPIATTVFLEAGQSNPSYRTYLEHSWLRLEAGETRKVRMMFEFAPDNLFNGVFRDKDLGTVRKQMSVPNRVKAVSRIEDPNDSPRHKIDVLAGVQAEVVTGRATVFRSFDAGDRTVRGSVVTVDGGAAAKGTAIVRVHQGTPDKVAYVYQPVKLIDGTFADKLKETGFAVDAYFSPARGYGDCWSERVAGRAPDR